MTFTCPSCSHEDELPADTVAAETVLECDQCRTRIAFGVPMPRAILSPIENDKFIMLSLDRVSLVLDKDYARELGKALASVS